MGSVLVINSLEDLLTPNNPVFDRLVTSHRKLLVPKLSVPVRIQILEIANNITRLPAKKLGDTVDLIPKVRYLPPNILRISDNFPFSLLPFVLLFLLRVCMDFILDLPMWL